MCSFSPLNGLSGKQRQASSMGPKKITAHQTVQATLNEMKLILHIIQSKTNKE
jgi:hypothetical protein